MATGSRRRFELIFGAKRPKLLYFSLGVAKGIVCPNVGCRFDVVDAKRSPVNFYGRCGFTLLDTELNRESRHPIMFMDLSKLAIDV